MTAGFATALYLFFVPPILFRQGCYVFGHRVDPILGRATELLAVCAKNLYRLVELLLINFILGFEILS